MSSQVTVYTGDVSNTEWSTDKVRVNTGTNRVILQVNIANLANGSVSGNTIYSNAIVIPANSKYDAFVGVGNYLSITGGNATLEAIGTASSGTKSIQ